MIQVSNEFKKAIKEPERRIKGYVEVLYEIPLNKLDIIRSINTTNIGSWHTSLNDLFNGKRVETMYGSLDYLPLDGTYLSMGEGILDDAGLITDKLFEEVNVMAFYLEFKTATTLNGITLYFRTNPPKNMVINYSDNTSLNITNNENETVQIIFDSPKSLTEMDIIINDMVYPDRKLYLMEMDFGISQLYKDQDLIEFTIDEEVNKLVEEVPINEVNIVLNNMNDLFNPLNPTGIVPYLSENTLIKPHIGVLTENLGVEYVEMGEFYFDSYTNNSDATTTLVGKNILKQVEQDEITDGLVGLTNSFIDQNNGTSPNLTTDIISRLGYECEFNPRERIAYYLHFLDYINLMSYFKDITLHDYSIFYANRNNKLIIRDSQTNSVDNITKQELINDANYKKIEKVNTLIKSDSRIESEGVSASGTNTTIFSSNNAQFVLTKSPQNFAIKNEAPRDVWLLNSSIDFTYSGATSAEIKAGSNNYTIVQATGVVGNTVSFNCVYENHTVSSKNIGQNYEITNRSTNEKKVAMEYTSTLNAYPARARTDLGQLEYSPSYEMSFEYNGDPSLEAGDYINVETPYGYKPLFIQKNRFKFDGGLSGSIEGVE